MADIRTELERELDYIEQQLKDNLDNIIDNAIDAILYVSLQSREPMGFDIGITFGGPNISLVYSRGACELKGSWGSISSVKDIDNEICEEILQYLSE